LGASNQRASREARSRLYTHEVELEDGRKGRYTSHELFGGGQCVKVHARESGETITILGLETPDGPCPERRRQLK
jgi:hypothetical protein